MNMETEKVVQNAYSLEKANQDIMRYVSGEIASASYGYLSTLYTTLSDETLKEPVFQDVYNSNKFFDLELDKKIVDTYKLDRKNSSFFQETLDVREVNRTCTSAATGVGTAVVGGALLAAIDIPVIGIIAGAIIVGLAGGSVTYCKIIPDMNKQRLLEAVKPFMADLEKKMDKWVDEIVAFYYTQVDELKKSL